MKHKMDYKTGHKDPAKSKNTHTYGSSKPMVPSKPKSMEKSMDYLPKVTSRPATKYKRQ